MNIGITGVTGNLGRRLLDHFLARLSDNDKIICLVRNLKISEKYRDDRITWIEGDINNSEALERLLESLDVCVHLASLVGFASKQQYNQVNKEGTESLCAAINRCNPKCRLIHCSSIAVLRRHTKKLWLNTDYANSKYDADCVVTRFSEECGLHANIVYPGIIYGPEDTNFIPTVSRYLKRGVVFFVRGGEHHCPAIFIDDLCELFWRVVSKTPANRQHFIGVGQQEYGMHQFIRELAVELGVSQPRLTLPKWCLLPLAIVLEALYRLVNSSKTPLISKRSVDMLSINLSPTMVRAYNQDFWLPRVTMKKGLEASIGWCKTQKLI